MNRSSSPTARAVRLIISAFRDRGWRDEANAALLIFEGIVASGVTIFDDGAALEQIVPDRFLLVNGITINEVREELTSAKASLDELAARSRAVVLPSIIQMADIDSFSRVRNIGAKDVANFSNPLDLLEDIVEQIIASIIGEVYRITDWAGENDDMFTAQMVLNGRNIRASFLLKGSGLRGPLKPKNLGKNGDQITRMMDQPAELFVVQHVNRIDPSVRKQLSDSVIARRAEGNQAAVGTVWDGIDTARMGVAYGFLDPTTGALKPGVLGNGS
jgi:hypothetical protein